MFVFRKANSHGGKKHLKETVTSHIRADLLGSVGDRSRFWIMGGFKADCSYSLQFLSLLKLDLLLFFCFSILCHTLIQFSCTVTLLI